MSWSLWSRNGWVETLEHIGGKLGCTFNAVFQTRHDLVVHDHNIQIRDRSSVRPVNKQIHERPDKSSGPEL
jgi:hypothetical protein